MSLTPSLQSWQPSVAHPVNTSATPMLSPTSAPKPSKAVPERKPKLRASCDACAASKVKCSKTHPICQRCTANGSQCIYGISRKHGKPGRTRKRNPDGTPFIKGQSKQRPSPSGSEFGKFRIHVEPLLPELPALPELPELPEIPEMEQSSWPSTPEWSPTPEFDYQMTPESVFSETDFTFMDGVLMTSTESYDNFIPTNTSGLTFRDPFAKASTEPLQLDASLPSDFQGFQDFVGSESVSPLDYAFSEGSSMESYFPDFTNTTQSPKESEPFNPLQTDVSMPISHCCYSLAYSTVESLHFRGLEYPGTDGSSATDMSLDSVLSVCKMAVQNVLQMLACSCSSDPHLAMLYSSITSKVITWYQIAAGLKPSVPSTPNFAIASSPSSSSSSSSSSFPSPLLAPSATNFNIKLQPLKIGVFEFDEADQEVLRRRVVLQELKKSASLVEALVQWRGGDDAEQAEFLYDVLGAWLKSELYKTVKDVTGGQQE